MDEIERVRQVRLETARRLDVITSTPRAILKYDRNGDGVMDDEELRIMRGVVEAEVVRELAGAADTDVDTTVDNAGEWTIDKELVDPHIDLPVLEVIDERYELLKELGRGSQGKTWLGRRRADGAYVALKELAFRDVDSWKTMELFERETAVLRTLDHPRVPGFIDAFHVELDGQPPRLFLVQEFVSGESLDVLIARGERFEQAQVVDFTRQMLEVLEYLHSLNPPVVHRDVKPANIIRGRDGLYFLVDFGGVQLVLPDELGGSTVIGTTGYMPPEQLTGRACPPSDLFALGATLIHLVTHCHPSRLPQERLKLKWRDRAGTAAPLGDFIDRLVAPAVEDRPSSAREAITLLGRPRVHRTPPTTHAVTALERQHMDMLIRHADERRPPTSGPRLRRDGPWLEVDLGSHGTRGLAWAAVCGGAAILGGALFGWTIGIVWGGAAIAVIALINNLQSKESIRLLPDGRFEYSRAVETTLVNSSGVIREIDARYGTLLITTDASELVCGTVLDQPTRDWLVSAIRLFLEHEDPRDPSSVEQRDVVLG